MRHLKEVGGDQDRNGIFNLNFRVFLVNVSHQPVKNVDVTVDRDVDVFDVFVVREILLEVFHVRNKNGSVALEVLISLFPLVAYMNNNLVTWMADRHP